MSVAEASGDAEQRDRLPLRPYAPSGAVEERTMRRMGLDRQSFSITNVVRCRPRKNFLENAPWEFSAINHCRANLREAIAERRPRVIRALGNIPTRELTGVAGDKLGVSYLNGYVLPLAYDLRADPAVETPVVVSFHPSFLRHGKMAYSGAYARVMQRAVNIAAGRDREWLWGVVPGDSTTQGGLRYETRPSIDEATAYLGRVRSSAGLVVSYDLETNESTSLDEDAREGFQETVPRLIQFATSAGEGIAMPWEGGYRRIAQQILATENIKVGHNVWLFDNKVLRAAGEREGIDLRPRGVIHDTLAMFHHWQPDLPAHLQFAASFVGFPFPWKHLAGTDIEFYGCCDVDATLRLYEFLTATLKKDDLYGDDTSGYEGQVYRVRPVLAAMEDRGMPIDDAARIALDGVFAAEQAGLGAELAAAAPEACRRVHPKVGYKGVPPEVKAALATGMFHEIDMRFDDGETYRYAQRDFTVADVDAVTGEPVTIRTTRWCRVYDFNPNSAPQLLAYMDARGHKRPKGKAEDDDGNAKDTTAKKELVRLANRHDDAFYLKVIEYREFTKMRGTYIDGFAPGPDGRVHTAFTFDTGTGQLTARNPNITNFPKRMRLAKQIRKIVAAPPGYCLVEWDYKSYHVVTTGFCAEDADYIRMAKIDMHSFVAAHLLKMDGADGLASMADDALAAYLQWFKTDAKRKWVRDNQAKPAILGIGFGMGYRRLYQENMEYFDGERDAKRLHDLLRALFPKVFAWQERIKMLAHQQQYLKSPFGHIRRFYEVFRWNGTKGKWDAGDQAEEAVAFLPANIAFGNIRETMKALGWWSFDQLYGLVNNVHDSFVFCFPADWLERHVKDVYPVLTAPSRVLKHPTLAPEGLTIDVEGCVGQNWQEMTAIKMEVANGVTVTGA